MVFYLNQKGLYMFFKDYQVGALSLLLEHPEGLSSQQVWKETNRRQNKIISRASYINARAPCRDPVKNIVNASSRSDVNYVIVNGAIIVENGKLLTIDEEELVKQVQKTTEAIWDRIPENQYLKQHSDEVSPQSFKPWD